MIAYAFDILQAERIQAHCGGRNSASEIVMQKLGMTLIDRTGVREYPRMKLISQEYLYAIER